MKFDLENFDENKVFKNLFYIVISVFILYPIIIYFIWGKWESGGLFGDSFGMLTSLFSSVAIILLILTLIIQKKEYKITQEEFKLSRIAQEQSKEALKKQAEILNIQKFENTFFKLFEIHLEIYKGLSFNYNDGKNAIVNLSNIISSHKSKPDTISLIQIRDGYNSFITYTKSLTNIFKYIDTYYPDEDISKRLIYLEFIFGQFTLAEWVVFKYWIKEIDSEIAHNYLYKYKLEDLEFSKT